MERAERRTRLVDAAMDAVRRYGPEASIDQIAEAAEVSKPVLYAEFGDKVGLVDAMAVELAGRVERRVMDRLAEEGNYDAERIIGAIVHSLINLIDDEPDLYAYIVRSLRMPDRGLLDNALARVIRDRIPLIVGKIGQDLQAGDLEMLADGVFGFVFAVVESWMGSRRPEKEELIGTVTAVIRAGLSEVTARRAAQRL